MKDICILGFTVKHKLGEGGMAEVWYAENSIKKKVAIKVLKQEFVKMASVVARFENEATTMVGLNHPNIRQVLAYELVNDKPCIVMEYLEGEDLRQRLINGEKFSDTQLQNWWNECADALNYTHSKGVIHRDIKPSNIFITADGMVKILDFGIAKAQDNIAITQTGTQMGTLLYMSPEQVLDAKHIDFRTDIYSLAVSFYHLILGTAPYDADSSSAFEIQTKIVNEPLNLDSINLDWRQFLTGYLQKTPGNRPLLTHFNINGKSVDVDSTKADVQYSAKAETNSPKDVSASGNVVINPAWKFHDGMAVINKNGKFGFVNEKGIEIVPPKYDEVDVFNEERARFRNGKKWGFLDTNGNEIVPATYTGCKNFKNGLAAVSSGRNAGYIDLNGYIALPLKYVSAGSFESGNAVVTVKNQAGYVVYIIIDTQGNALTPECKQIDRFTDFPDVLLLTTYSSGKCGLYKNGSGIILPPEYGEVRQFDDKYFILRNSEKYGMFHINSGIVLPVKYDSIEIINGQNVAIENKKYYNVECQNETVSLSLNYELTNRAKKKSLLRKRIRIGLVVILMAVLISVGMIIRIINPFWLWSMQFSQITMVDTNNQYYIVKKGEKFGLVNNKKDIVIKCNYLQLDRVFKNYYRAKLGNKYGLIDIEEKIILPFEYDDIWGQQNGSINYINLENNDFRGVADVNAKIVVPVVYESIYFPRNDSLIIAKHKSKYGLINMNNEILLPFEYANITSFEDSCFLIKKRGKMGLYSKQDGLILHPKYEDIQSYSFGKFRYKIKANGLYGLTDKFGNILVPCEYDVIEGGIDFADLYKGEFRYSLDTKGNIKSNGRKIQVQKNLWD